MLCARHLRAQHTIAYVPPRKGERLAMIGDARHGGCADLVHDGNGWVADPQGRPIEHSVWMDIAAL